MTDTESAYDRVADDYDRLLTSRDDTAIRGVLHSLHERYIPPGSHVLDVGCGSGLDAITLAARGCRVLAIDVSGAMIERTTERARTAGVTDHVDARRLAIEDLASIRGDLDAIVSSYASLNTQDSLIPFASFASDRLRPGGVAIVHVLNRWWWFGALANLRHGRTPFPREIDPAIGGLNVRHHRFSRGDVVRAFRDFTLDHTRALPLFGSGQLLRRVPDGVARVAHRADRRLGHVAGLAAIGELSVYVLVRRS